MCLSPTIIKNPYCGCDPSKGYNYLHDCISTKIAVPCGHCKECINSRQSAFAVRCDLEGYNYVAVPFMLTLTYNNSHLPRFPKVGDLLDDFAFPDWMHVQNMMKRLRNKIVREPDTDFARLFVPFEKVEVNGRERLIPPFKYVFVSEFGKVHLRPHFHALIYVKTPYRVQDVRFEHWRNNVEKALFDFFKDAWSINIGTRSEPVYESLFTYIVKGNRKTYDFHAIRHLDNVADSSPVYYVSKYLFKANNKLETLKKRVYIAFKEGSISPERYQKFREVTSRHLRVSKYFGYPFDDEQIKRINKGFRYAISQKMPFPCYIASDGQQQVFPQYLKRLITPDLATSFCYNIKNSYESDVRELEKISLRDARASIAEDEAERIRRSIRNYDDNLCDFDGYTELRNYESSCQESEGQRFNYYQYKDRKPDFCSGIDPDVDFYRHDIRKKDEQVIELFLFNNSINFDVL